jgi:hypothetical protein
MGSTTTDARSAACDDMNDKIFDIRAALGFGVSILVGDEGVSVAVSASCDCFLASDVSAHATPNCEVSFENDRFRSFGEGAIEFISKEHFCVSFGAAILKTSFLPSLLNRSENFVSNPMLVNAKENQRPCSALRSPLIKSTVCGEITKEKRREAAINPRTNFGNRSQIIPRVGLDSKAVADVLLVYVQ